MTDKELIASAAAAEGADREPRLPGLRVGA